MSRVNQPPSRAPATEYPEVHAPKGERPQVPDARLPQPGGAGEPPGGVPRPAGAPPTEAARAATQAQTATPQRRLSAAEAERLASQSGYARGAQRRRRPGLDLDDMAQAPIPLPVDEVDPSAWEQGSLDQAQERLSLHGHQAQALAAAGAAGGGVAQEGAEALVGGAFSPTAADVQRLEAIAARAEAAGEPPPLGDPLASLQQLFGLGLERLPPGVARLAAALVVAGRGASVAPAGDSLAADKLAEGLGGAIAASNKSVSDARGMHEGITLKLAHQRTFVVKR